MSGDEKQNFEAILEWSEGARGEEELSTPQEALERISPAYHFDRITAAISIHHGRADALVPLRWSQETCEKLKSLEKEVICTYYDDMPHTFYGDIDQEFIENTIAFFNLILY
jgi:dipeptidyl aminopeptidase/acylaminoacyl peptidase